MTTMIDTLLARALDYEQKAAALRLAAEELTDHQTTTKQTKIGGQLAAAIAVRQQQRPAPKLKPTGYADKSEIAARLALIREALGTGPKTTKELTALLHAHGAQIGHDRVRQMLHEQLKGEIVGRGGAVKARWHLRGVKVPRATPAKRRTRTKPQPTQAQLDQRTERIRRILADGAPHPIADITRQLGERLSPSRVRQHIKQHLVEVIRRGSPRYSTYTLPQRKAPTQTAAATRAAAAKRAKARGGRPATSHPQKARNPAKAPAKATLVASILRDADRPVPIKELTAIARASGITEGLTGIHNYVKQGFIKRTVNGSKQPSYSFVAMPPESSAASA